MNSPSFESFHAQLDCKLTYGNKNQTQLTLVLYILFRVQKQNRNDEKHSQTGITVTTRTSNDVVMLRSNAANSSWQSPVIADK